MSIIEDSLSDRLPEQKRALLTKFMDKEERNAFPLSFAQSRLWILDRFQQGNPAYNIPAMNPMQGWVDTIVLERCLNEIIRRHESLRTVFQLIDGKPAQVIMPELQLDLEIIDLRKTPKEEKNNEMGRIYFEEGRRSFDLEKGPLIRASFIKIDKTNHTLIVVMHHIISDGWSMTVFYQELSALYMAFLQGQRSPLPELPIQYADFAQWQADWFQGDVVKDQLDYWRTQLSGLRPVLDLATDRPRQPVLTNSGDIRGFSIERYLCEDLKRLSQTHNATLFMTLLAAFYILLYRLSGETDIGVGSPIANRTMSELEGLIGFFVNTLVLRTDLSGDPTFIELLARVREVALGAYGHQDMPFEKLVDELQLDRDLSHNPLFQILFAVQNIGSVDQNAQTPAASTAPAMGNGTAKFDLTMSMLDTGAGAQGFLEFNIDLFDGSTADTFIERYKMLLQDIVEYPDKRLSELSILTMDEREYPEKPLFGADIECKHRETIGAILSERAKNSPDDIAIIADGIELNYFEINQRAERFALWLKKTDVSQGSSVAVTMSRGVDRLTAIFGILKAGCICVMIDPLELEVVSESPSDGLPPRLKQIFADASPSLIITDESTKSQMTSETNKIVCFDDVRSEIENESDISDLPTDITPDTVALHIYESVSAEKLKAVEMTHQTLCHIACDPSIKLKSTDRVAHISYASSLSAYYEIFGAITAGATTVCITETLKSIPRKFATTLRDSEVTVLFSPVTKLKSLAREFPWALRKVRLILSDEYYTDWELFREGLRPEVIGRMFCVFGDLSAKGYFAVQPLGQLTHEDSTIPIGKPTAGRNLYLLDTNLEPSSVGVPGKIFIDMNSLNLILDKENPTLIHSPHIDEEDALLYPTGDIGRRLSDGNIEYGGRDDGRLVVDGISIYPEEIVSILCKHPEIKDAAVGLRRRHRSRNRGIAALIEFQNEPINDDEINKFLASRLPKHMIPTVFKSQTIPRDTSGNLIQRDVNEAIVKIDSLKATRDPYIAPNDDIETALAQIWAETLGIERVGIKDNFFRIGGHSLLATQAVVRISDTFQIDISLQKLFENPTIEQLAQIVKPLIGSDFKPETPTIVRVPRDKPLPLSFGQQRLWFLDQFEPDSAFYNIAINFPLNGPIVISDLEAAFNDIIERHETLRTTFDFQNDQPIQLIAPAYKISMAVHDIQEIPKDQQKTELQRLISEEAQTPFDLKNGSVVRAGIIKVSETEHVLLFTVHHIAADGWSTDIIFRELWEFYDAHRSGRTAKLPELKVQYADFASWQRIWLTGATLEKQLRYWKRQLEGAPPLLELPTDRPRPRLQTFNGGMYVFSMSASLLESLKDISDEEQITLFTTLLAGFNVLLHKYTGCDDIVVGSPIANRTRPELELLIGFFANTLVFRAKLSDDMTFRQLMLQLRKVTLEGYEHQDIPFEKLVEEFQPERNLSYNPLFQIMFALQNTSSPTPKSPTSDESKPIIGSAVSKFDLTMFVTEATNGLQIGIEYNTDLFDKSTISLFAEHYEALLVAAVNDPDIALSKLSMLTSEETMLLSEWNETSADFDRINIHKMFEEQVLHTPDATALSFEGQSMSYHELNERANYWAHHLIDLGIQPDNCVSISMKRSLNMIITVLAILKAGAAYVPIDPNYPKDRKDFMIADSKVTVLFTDAERQDEFLGSEINILTIDSQNSEAMRDDNPSIMITSDNLAYVIYTSGSTGKPKGVAMPHTALTNLIQWQNRRSELPAGANTLQFASLSFDVSFQEIFSTLCSGGSLILISESQRRDPGELWKKLESERINRLFLPYVALQQLAEHAKKLSELPNTLTEVITAGEQLQITPQIALLFERLNATLYNQYGPTESHVVTELKLTGSTKQWDTLPTIGQPIPNATIHILDPSGEPCGVGIPGELCIGGETLAQGYLHRVDLTVERFIPDSQGGDGQRLYKTGDSARFLPDGNIQYLGRIDEQVKIRGFRVEPGEVEAALRTSPMVNETVVVGRGKGSGEVSLVAYVESNPQNVPTSQQLHNHLASLLPEYMVPAMFVVIESLPLTPSGKLNRRSLPSPEISIELDIESMGPQTPVEEALVEIWREVLQLQNIGVQDNFFELGGHSLLATRVISRVFDEFGADLPVRKIFESPTIESLALVVTETVLESQKDDNMAILLSEIEQMPDDAVRDLLQES